MKTENKMTEVQRIYNKPLRELLIELYAQYGTAVQVSNVLNVSVNTLYIWVMRCGLEQKTVLVDRAIEVKS